MTKYVSTIKECFDKRCSLCGELIIGTLSLRKNEIINMLVGVGRRKSKNSSEISRFYGVTRQYVSYVLGNVCCLLKVGRCSLCEKHKRGRGRIRRLVMPMDRRREQERVSNDFLNKSGFKECDK